MRLLTRKSVKRSSPTSFLQSDAYRNHKESDILDAPSSSSSNGRKSFKTTRRGFSQLRQQFALKSATSKVILVVSILSAASVLIGLAVYVIFWLYHHGQCYGREAGVHFVEGPAHFMERQCPPPPYETISTSNESPKICITSLTDTQSPSRWQRMIRCRDFDALPTLPKMKAYAEKHGYVFVDSSPLIDTSRPPAWSKIRAVQALLDSKSNDKRCDWVVWWDADVLIMNSDIRIESLLPTPSSPIHLVATFDRKFTVNSGAWLIRNSPWSTKFLEAWWNHAAWVRRPGMSLSGDNAAFGHFVSNLLDNPTEASHIAIPERCNLNSFGVFLTEQQKQLKNKVTTTDYSKEEWYMSPKFYHKGDFVVHASGIDQKGAVLELMAERAT